MSATGSPIPFSMHVLGTINKTQEKLMTLKDHFKPRPSLKWAFVVELELGRTIPEPRIGGVDIDSTDWDGQ